MALSSGWRLINCRRGQAEGEPNPGLPEKRALTRYKCGQRYRFAGAALTNDRGLARIVTLHVGGGGGNAGTNCVGGRKGG